MFSGENESNKIITLPNILSVFRLLLIPFFLYVYFAGFTNAKILAALILIFSGLTDVLDGYIARKYDLVTKLGKILDPVADKLTQASVCVSIVVDRTAPLWILIIFIVKEILMVVGGARLIKKGRELSSAKWFGKLSTVVFFIVMIAIILFDLEGLSVIILILISMSLMVFSFFMYLPIFIKLISKKET